MTKHIGNRIGYAVSFSSDGGIFNSFSQFYFRKTIGISGGQNSFTGNGYEYQVFTSPGTLLVARGSASVDYMIVAGGGSGGGADGGGGGGGGGSPPQGPRGGYGGGVGLYGQGTNGAGASNDGNGGAGSPHPSGSFGGAAGSGEGLSSINGNPGAVRIIWGGVVGERIFPSTNVT